MGDLGITEEWGLQAVVRSCTNGSSITSISDSNPESCFGPFSIQNDGDLQFLFNCPDFFEATTLLANELEELYKPFYPISDPLSPQINITSPSDNILSVSVEAVEAQPVEKVQEKSSPPLSGSTVVAAATAAGAVKHKRRKNQQKRVVVRVTAEGLSSDMWAWRKYGQKPIKGSPYPRSYYRCSTSKGCLARKQVEQSCSDPGMFIITYTADHGHSQPTRRSSLAGTSRHKFSPPKCLITSNNELDGMAKTKACNSSPIPTAALSPTTHLMASAEEDRSPQQTIKNEEEEQQQMMNTEESDDAHEFDIPDMTLSDDFFAGFDGDLAFDKL